MAKRQQQYKLGAQYKIKGPAKKERRVKLVGRAEIHGKDVLLFQPVRKLKKRHRKKK